MGKTLNYLCWNPGGSNTAVASCVEDSAVKCIALGEWERKKAKSHVPDENGQRMPIRRKIGLPSCANER